MLYGYFGRKDKKMMRLFSKIWWCIIFILVVSLGVLYIYGAFDASEDLILKNKEFYTSLFAFNSPLFAIIVAKYNNLKTFKFDDKARIKNSIFDILEKIQDNIKLFEQKYKAKRNDDFSEINENINMSLSKLTKELAYFYGKQEIADGIVGTAIFERVNSLSSDVEMAEIREVACEMQNIDKRVREKIECSLYSML